MPSPLPFLCAKLSFNNFQFFRFHSVRRLAALLLAIQLFFIPSQVSARAMSDAIKQSSIATAEMRDSFLTWLMISPPQEPRAQGIKSPPPEQLGEKLGRLVRLQINPKGPVQLEQRQSIVFTAVPFDAEGSAIHGLQADWESSDRQVVFVRRDGQALAGKSGRVM